MTPDPAVSYATQGVAYETAQTFAMAGRRFREWAAIPKDRSRTWKGLLDEAVEFAIAHPTPAKKQR